MNCQLKRIHLVWTSAALLALTACGGGGGSAPAPDVTPSSTNVSTKVVDGAIKNAVVCLDKNANGKCDVDETQGTTDAGGNATLAVANADVGKYPLLAIIGTDAVDADNGPVTVAYTMSAPADQTGVVSPLTTLVQQTIASTGVTTAEAAKAIQDATGITASLFQDFTNVAAPSDGSVNPATVARMVVVTTQQQASAIAGTLGTAAIDGATITQADLDKAIQRKLLELLPALVSALSDPAVLAATTPADKAAALLAAATTLVTKSGLTPASVPTVVAINTQNSTITPVTTTPPVAGLSLATLSFTDASNYLIRTLGGSVAQNTPDASNNVKFVERRRRAVAGNVATWGAGGDPTRNSDLSWNGSAWAACPINFENTSSLRDAFGNSVYNYCGRETGKSNRATFDISGKTMASVYAQIVGAGYTNLHLDDPALLGTASFPTDAKLFYQATTPLTESISYYPAGANSPPGFSNVVTQYSAAIAGGGVASTQPAGAACNSTEYAGSGQISTSLETMIAAKRGTPCIFAQGSITYNGVTYLGDPVGESWGNSTLGMFTVGSVPLTPAATSTGFYTGNTLLRYAFTGSGTNAVTYYACKQRYVNGSPRNCTVIGTGSYAITPLGDARALTLNNLPIQTSVMTYNTVLVERGGVIYYGYQGKPIVSSQARLNLAATNALLGQLGVAPIDPTVPLALTAGSYVGSWDVRSSTAPALSTNGVSVFFNSNGSYSCFDRSTSVTIACSYSLTDPSTGAFTYSSASGGTASGTFDFMSGSVAGTFHDPSSTPTDGTLVGARR